MTNTPLYTLTEAMEAKDSIVSTVEFAFFTALADITDAGGTPDIGSVTGGAMAPHRGRHELIVALVERLLYDDDLVLYPAEKPESQGSST